MFKHFIRCIEAKFYTLFYSIILFRKKKRYHINKYCVYKLNLNKYKILTFFFQKISIFEIQGFFEYIILHGEYITMQKII